jgi:hypothetical protein
VRRPRKWGRLHFRGRWPCVGILDLLNQQVDGLLQLRNRALQRVDPGPRPARADKAHDREHKGHGDQDEGDEAQEFQADLLSAAVQHGCKSRSSRFRAEAGFEAARPLSTLEWIGRTCGRHDAQLDELRTELVANVHALYGCVVQVQ